MQRRVHVRACRALALAGMAAAGPAAAAALPEDPLARRRRRRRLDAAARRTMAALREPTTVRFSTLTNGDVVCAPLRVESGSVVPAGDLDGPVTRVVLADGRTGTTLDLPRGDHESEPALPDGSGVLRLKGAPLHETVTRQTPRGEARLWRPGQSL